MAGKVSVTEALKLGAPPLREFMLKQTREADLALFIELEQRSRSPGRAAELPMTVVIPAYVISELKTGFQMGFFLFVPFLLIDLVVSTTLLSMGMMQLPPAMVSLPFKVLLFVMIDGWNLVVGSIVGASRRPCRNHLIVGIVRQAIEVAIMVSMPMLLAGLVAGVLVSIFQTVTSIQDNVLAFIPRAAAIFAVFALTFPWILRVVTGFSRI